MVDAQTEGGLVNEGGGRTPRGRREEGREQFELSTAYGEGVGVDVDID